MAHTQDWIAVALVLALCSPCSTWAQNKRIDLRLDAKDIGLNGWIRPGAWTPLRLELTNHEDQPQTVRCQWVFTDADGDQVLAYRRATLNAKRMQRVWLYGAVPMTIGDRSQSRLEVLDDKSNRILTALTFSVPRRLDPYERAVGVIGDMSFQLEAYEQDWTQHERCRVLSGLDLKRMPDRWYGLSMIETLVWSGCGDAPGAPGVHPETLAAIRQWVRRGGHLVVSLPAHGDPWTHSTLADILPAVKPPVTMVGKRLPRWLGQPVNLSSTIEMKRLEPTGQDTVVLLHDDDREPVVVTASYGFGRVTLLGIDLTDIRLTRLGLPSPISPLPCSRTLWREILRWQGPIYTDAYIESEKRAGKFVYPITRTRIDLAYDTIAPHTRMVQTAAPALTVAILFFGTYWLVAGPIGYAVLRKRGKSRYAWLTFTGTVAVFTVLAWGGALLLWPQEDRIEHFSVIDAVVRHADRPDEALVRVRSWLALLVARHGWAQVSLARSPGGGAVRVPRNTLANVGLNRVGEAGKFLGIQRYRVDAAAPDQIRLPVRSTAKLLNLDYVGPIGAVSRERAEPWVFPNGTIGLRDGLSPQQRWPTGQLVHGLPGTLIDVRIVYSPGDGRLPVTWRSGDWPPRTILQLGQPTKVVPLWAPPAKHAYTKRCLADEGHLGYLMSLNTGRWGTSHVVRSTGTDGGHSELVSAVEMLSFFTSLPPPVFRVESVGSLQTIPNYMRSMGRGLDLTHLLAMRRLIIIGHLKQGPNPIPLKVDGRKLPARGWTVVRWICPI